MILSEFEPLAVAVLCMLPLSILSSFMNAVGVHEPDYIKAEISMSLSCAMRMINDSNPDSEELTRVLYRVCYFFMLGILSVFINSDGQ